MEIIKHGLISDKKFFDWLEKNLQQILALRPQVLEKAIKRSIEIKADDKSSETEKKE